MNDQLMLEIVKVRCTRCDYITWALIPPQASVTDQNALVIMRCGKLPERSGMSAPAPCGGVLRVESGRKLAWRQVTVGEGKRWDVDEPTASELIGGRPGRVRVYGPNARGAR